MSSGVLIAVNAMITVGCIALPGILVRARRQRSRAASELALAIEVFARSLRVGGAPRLDPVVVRVAGELRVPEFPAFAHAVKVAGPPEQLADAARRLVLRIRRRIAFERKMLARTASGRRRAALFGALPGALLLGAWWLEPQAIEALVATRTGTASLLAVGALQVTGCALLARIARVEI